MNRKIIQNLVNRRDESRILFPELKHERTQSVHGCGAQIRSRVQSPDYGMDDS